MIEISLMALQVNIVLLLFGGLQGLFLSFILLKKKIYKAGYTFLLAYLVVMILQIILKVASKIWLIQNMQSFYFFSYQFPFLYGPLVYLFARQFFLQKKLQVTDALHFLPAMIALTYFITGIGDNFKLFLPLFSPLPRLIAEFNSILIYHFLAWRIVINYPLQIKNSIPEITELQHRWIKQFILISAILCMVISVTIFLLYMWYPFNQDLRFSFIALTLFTYWISYCAWNQPQVFAAIPGFAINTEDGNTVTSLKVYRTSIKYANSGLSNVDTSRILGRLNYLMDEKKLYLDAELTIEQLAEAIPCSRHHLSQALNQQLQKSFYDYINAYRVEETKTLLADPLKTNHKIASIAYDAGFNSLSAFNDIFKKFTGSTPSQYRKQPKEQSQKQRV